MSLKNPEIMKNAGELLKDIGLAIKEDSDGGKKITIQEWIKLGTKFFTEIGADLIDEDED